MSAPICACGCGRPVADGYARHDCARRLAQTLTVAAGHAEDAWDVIARQARVGTAGGARRLEPEPPPAPEDLRRNPVTAFGWQASVERPIAGALRPEPTPVDLGASDRYAAVGNTMTTWARHVAEERNDRPMAHAGANPIAHAARYLAVHADHMRGQPWAGEAFDELERACRQLERLVDRPADKELVGVCDCGKVLYAAHGRRFVTCPVATCQLQWEVENSRDILRDALRERLFTASECARLAAFWHERTQPQIRALITTWTRPDRHRLEARGWIPNDDYTGDGDEPTGWATYLLGDVLDLLAQTPRRERKTEGAVA